MTAVLILVAVLTIATLVGWRYRRVDYVPAIPESDAELASWIRCLEAEYRAGQLNDFKLKSEVDRYVRIWEQDNYVLWPAERAAKVRHIVDGIKERA